METFLDTVGAVSLIVLVLIGLAAGGLAGVVAGRNRAFYLVMGVVGAVALPFVMAALGVGAVIAGGLVVIAVIGLIGAVLLVALVRALRG